MEIINQIFTTSPLNRQILIVLAIIVGIIAWKAMQKAANLKSYELLSEEEFLTKGKNKIIDVRQPQDFEFDHIKGAKNVPSMDLRTKPVTWPLSTELYLYHYSEKGAASAARTLYKRGYRKIYVLKGGLVPFKGDTVGRLTKEMEIATPKGRDL